MKPRINENEKRIVITCKKAVVDEAKAQGFERIDTYIQYLKARLNDCEKQKSDFIQVIETYKQKEEAKKEPVPTPDLVKTE